MMIPIPERGIFHGATWLMEARAVAGDPGDRDALCVLADRLDGVVGAHLAFLEDAHVKARPVMGHRHGYHLRLVHADADPVTRDPWLRDLEQGAANAVTLADADFVVGLTVDGQVLAELPHTKSLRPMTPCQWRHESSW